MLRAYSFITFQICHWSMGAVAKSALCSVQCFTSYIIVEDEDQLFSRNTLPHPASISPSSPLVRRKGKRDLIKVMEEEAQGLLSYFNHRNVDALLRLTRNTLETLHKRIHASTLTHFSGRSYLTMLLLSGLWLDIKGIFPIQLLYFW